MTRIMNRRHQDRFSGRSGVACVLSLLICITMAGCGSHSRKETARHHHKEVTLDLSHASKTGKRIIEEAYTWMGTPYIYAGAEKGRGTDCSGMVLRVYEDVCGVKLPRNSAKQAEFCKEIRKRDVKTGDLVFFATGKDPRRISHVGIMIDDDNFIHASSSKGVVVSQVSTPYYIKTFIQYGRVPL